MPGPFAQTLMVWKALFLRETLDRFFANRLGWMWLVVEPASHVAIMVCFYSIIRGNGIGGMSIALWVAIGLLTFFLFRRTAVQTLHALDCNRAFFAFRQVRPFDVAVCRAGVEAFSMFFVFLFMLGMEALFGLNVLADNILISLCALLGMWLFGVGYGMISSVCMRLVPDSGHIIQLLMLPLYFISGAIIPLTTVPQPYRDWMLWNPLLHGVELVRVGWRSNYCAENVSMSYLFFWAITLLFFGMALYRVLETRLLTQ